MTNLRQDNRTSLKIDFLLTTIGEDSLRTRIDIPILNAVIAFRLARYPVSKQTKLHEILGDFLRYVYEYGTLFPQKLTEEQAQAEAVHILESEYQNSWAKGYHAAILDNVHSVYDGLNSVVDALTEIIRQRERRKFITCALHTAVDPLDWEERVLATREIVNRIRPYLANNMEDYTPARLAGNWDSLVQMDNETDRVLYQALHQQSTHSIL